MLHLSSYHSNGLPTVVWSNKVNLIGEKVYKPKIHFCEHCNKPILIYGRLIPCKHVFCFTCATLCLTKSQQSIKSASSPPPLPNSNNNNNNNNNDSSKNLDLHKSDESTSNTTPTTVQQETMDSPNLLTSGSSKGCHRCGGKALRVERNTLNSIFVCQIETCRRTYLSVRDLQAHVTHRHSKNKSSNQHAGTSSASMAAISASPYISSSTLLHLNSHNERHQRQSLSASNNNHHNNGNNRLSNNSPNFHPNHHHNQNHHNQIQHHHSRENGSQRHHRPPSHHQRDRERERNRFRDRDNFQRDRERERENKEYHRQSIQRAAQWAEASAQMMEKGLTR